MVSSDDICCANHYLSRTRWGNCCAEKPRFGGELTKQSRWQGTLALRAYNDQLERRGLFEVKQRNNAVGYSFRAYGHSGLATQARKPTFGK